MPNKEYISPISSEDGAQVINANCTQSNDDPIRAARLKEKAEQGDEEAREKLEEMDNTDMVRIVDDEEGE